MGKLLFKIQFLLQMVLPSDRLKHATVLLTLTTVRLLWHNFHKLLLFKNFTFSELLIMLPFVVDGE